MGLVLNSRRAKEGDVLRSMRAHIYAASLCDLPSSIFESEASSSDEAADMAFDANVARRTARAMRNKSFKVVN